MFWFVFDCFSLIEEDKRSIKSTNQHNIITSFFEAILLSSIYSLSYYFFIIIFLFLLYWCCWYCYFINIIMKIILFIHKIPFVLKHWFFKRKWKLFFNNTKILKMLFIRRVSFRLFVFPEMWKSQIKRVFRGEKWMFLSFCFIRISDIQR